MIFNGEILVKYDRTRKVLTRVKNRTFVEIRKEENFFSRERKIKLKKNKNMQGCQMYMHTSAAAGAQGNKIQREIFKNGILVKRSHRLFVLIVYLHLPIVMKRNNV